MIKEACVETIEQAIAAERQGADRLEYCARLDLDGLTPDFEEVKALQQQCSLPIHVMIRPRAGDFIYTEEELKRMGESIEQAIALKLAGVVFGITNAQAELDIPATRSLAASTKDLAVTIHKAIDTVLDPLKAIEQLAEIPQVKYLLSSGLAETAELGLPKLKEMHQLSKRRGIHLIAAGRVTAQNLPSLHEALQCQFYHGTKIVGELA